MRAPARGLQQRLVEVRVQAVDALDLERDLVLDGVGDVAFYSHGAGRGRWAPHRTDHDTGTVAKATIRRYTAAAAAERSSVRSPHFAAREPSRSACHLVGLSFRLFCQVGAGLWERLRCDQSNGYINAIDQSLVPDEASSGLSFSVRVSADHRPNAFALPDGRIFVSSGLLTFVENEAQLAVVLGHEIAHVVEGHTLDSIRKQRSSEKRNKIIGTAAGAMIANAVTAIPQGKYSREQEKEADLIGAEIAMANGFDPQAGVSLFEKLHRLYGRRQRGIRSMAPGGPATGLDSGLPVSMALNSHPRADARAKGIKALISGNLGNRFTSMQSAGELSTGSGRFERVTSGLRRDASILLAERIDRYDLALEGLESVQRVRPNDPKLLWAMGRIYRLAGRTPEHLDKARKLLMQAAEEDRRQLFPAIHRDLAYLHATRADDFEAAAESLKTYVLGHIGKHGSYPADLEATYDHLALFGESEWTAPAPDSGETDPLVQKRAYVAPVWRTPGGHTAADAS